MQRELRLRKGDDFARLRAEGQSTSQRQATLSYLPNTLSHNRYGFIVSKRVGKAVVRNRTRRRLREAVREMHPMITPGFDIVFIARTSLVDVPFTTVQRTARDLLRKAGLFGGASL